MSSFATSDAVTRAIDRLGLSGTLGRELAVRLDMVRSTGLGPAVRRLRSDAMLARFGGDDDDAYRRIWTDAAEELGAAVTPLPGGFLKIEKDGVWTRVLDNLVMLDDGVTLRFALQKTLVNALLASEGVPVPEGLEFDAFDLAPAEAFLAAGPIPCVVKPVGSSGGYAVTSGIRTKRDLIRARLRGSRVDRRLMIERQATGDFYRFLILDGVLLDVVRRRPPRVTGDGRSTVVQLIEAENRRRVENRHQEMLWPLRIDLDCVMTLEATGLSLSSIVPAGATVPVKTVVSQGTMRDNETVRDPIAPALVDQTIEAARLVGLRLAGVDVITPSLSSTLDATGGVIIEVNGPPGLNYHYDVAQPANRTRVAVPILRALLNDARARSG
jgi:cyanophycin synthetase